MWLLSLFGKERVCLCVHMLTITCPVRGDAENVHNVTLLHHFVFLLWPTLILHILFAGNRSKLWNNTSWDCCILWVGSGLGSYRNLTEWLLWFPVRWLINHKTPPISLCWEMFLCLVYWLILPSTRCTTPKTTHTNTEKGDSLGIFLCS